MANIAINFKTTGDNSNTTVQGSQDGQNKNQQGKDTTTTKETTTTRIPLFNNLRNIVNGGKFNGTNSDDFMSNQGNSVTTSAYSGNDTINNKGSFTSLSGGAGNDYIKAGDSSQAVTLYGGAGNDTLIGSNPNLSGNVFQFGSSDGNNVITGFNGNDTIHLIDINSANKFSSSISGSDVIIKASSTKVTIKGASSENLTVRLSDGTIVTVKSGKISQDPSTPTSAWITNTKKNTVVSGKNTSDSISNSGSSVTISAGNGNDFIRSSGASSSIGGGNGNDTISVGASTSGVTLNGGKGNDSLIGSANKGDVFQFGSADGNDIITNYSANDTLYFSDISAANRITASASASNSSDMVITAGNTKVTLQGAASKSIKARLSNGTMTTIKLGTGKNTVKSGQINNSTDSTSVSGSGSADTISNSGKYVYINAGNGNDLIKDTGNYVLADGGAGNDTISVGASASGVTLNGGKGNDTLIGSTSKGDIFQFGTADGNDVIINYSANDTIYFSGINATSSISSSKQGNDLILGAGSTKVTVKGAASKAVNLMLADGSSTTINNGVINKSLISNSKDSVKLNGTSSADSISNDGWHVTISGGKGNDTIDNGYGDYSSINGGAGNDYINAYYSGGVTLSGGKGNDTLIGSYRGSNVFQFGSDDGNDILNNYGTNDIIQLIGINSASAIKHSVKGSDLILTAGSTKVTLKDAAGEAVKVKLGNGNMTTIKPITPTLSGSTSVNNETNKAVIIGTSSADSIYNDANNVSINGGSGKDKIQSFGRFNTIFGGTDNDSIVLGAWLNSDGSRTTEEAYRSYVDAGDGADTINNVGCGNYTTLKGGKGNDYINSSSWYASILGGVGNDTIFNGYNSNDSYTFSSGTFATLNGGDGDDSIANYVKYVTIAGGKGNDTVTLGTNAENNVIIYNSGEGNDIIKGYDSNDTLQVSGQYSTQKSGSNTIINFSSGAVTLSGYTGKTNIRGGTYIGVGKDTYISNEIDSTIITGSSSADLIENRASYVTINAGGGNDSIYASSKVTISGSNTIYGSDKHNILNGGAGNDSILNYNSYSSLSGGAGNDYIDNSGSHVTINGGAGNDTFYGNDPDDGGGDIFQFGNNDGNDFIVNYFSDDTLHLTGIYSASDINSSFSGYNSQDLVISFSNTKVTLDGVGNRGVRVKLADGTLTTIANNPTINYIDSYISSTLVSGTSGADYIDNSGYYVTINAGAGNDTIENYYSHNSSLFGGAGNDYIDASSSFNTTLNGGKGNDTLTGHTSGYDDWGNYWYHEDVFQFGNHDGSDVITNYDVKRDDGGLIDSFYEDGVDIIHLMDITDFTSVKYYNVGNDKVVSLSSDGIITIKDAAYKDIHFLLGSNANYRASIASGAQNYSSNYMESNIEEELFTEDDSSYINSDLNPILNNLDLVSDEYNFNSLDEESLLHQKNDITSLTYKSKSK